MVTELLLPAIVIGFAALFIPRRLERFVPETLAGLALLTLLSSTALLLLSGFGFSILYHIKNPEVTETLLRFGSAGVLHFLSLGAKAGLIWGPILALGVSTAPRRWKVNTW